MRNVLFLAYFFPPLGGPGTQRSAKLVRDLPAHGYQPLVVTGPGASTDRWDPEDATLMADVPDDVRVVRVEGAPPPNASRTQRWLDVMPPIWRWWVDGAVEAARPLLSEVDVIYAGMGPYQTAFAAARLAGESGIPWIADLRDPWALDEMQIYPTAMHRRRTLARMRGVLASAHAIVMNTPEAATALQDAFPELGMKLVRSIPNGYDAADFPPRLGPPRTPDGRFRIVHSGSLHTDDGLRQARRRRMHDVLGGAKPVDVLARSHVHLVAALRELAQRVPQIGDAIELHLAGVVTEADRAVAAGTNTIVHGYLDHLASVELVRSADLLFLPMHDLPAGHRARIVPGKTYEYLASGRPILAGVPDGDARDRLLRAPTATVCRPTDVAALAEAVALEARHVLEHGPRPDAQPEIATGYERALAARALAEVLDRLTSRVRTLHPRTAPHIRLVV
jgi:glycosyltransferase involved in cell wall biosynthesis